MLAPEAVEATRDDSISPLGTCIDSSSNSSSSSVPTFTSPSPSTLAASVVVAGGGKHIGAGTSSSSTTTGQALTAVPTPQHLEVMSHKQKKLYFQLHQELLKRRQQKHKAHLRKKMAQFEHRKRQDKMVSATHASRPEDHAVRKDESSDRDGLGSKELSQVDVGGGGLNSEQSEKETKLNTDVKQKDCSPQPSSPSKTKSTSPVAIPSLLQQQLQLPVAMVTPSIAMVVAPSITVTPPPAAPAEPHPQLVEVKGRIQECSSVIKVHRFL